MCQSCFLCRFFSLCNTDVRSSGIPLDELGDVRGFCRINPPTVGRFCGPELKLEYDYGQWPIVQPSDWCGAFQPSQPTPLEGTA